MLELYKKAFGGPNTNGRMSKSDKEDIYWFLTSVTSHVSSKTKNKRSSTYKERVTVTDEAFALMVLQHHCYKWKPDERDKKKRVTGDSKGKSMKYYMNITKELSDYREANDEKFKYGESWLQNRMDEEEEEEGRKKTSGSKNDDEEDDDDEEEDDLVRAEYEIRINPHLQEFV